MRNNKRIKKIDKIKTKKKLGSKSKLKMSSGSKHNKKRSITKNKSGSKKSQYDSVKNKPKRRGRRPKKIIEDSDNKHDIIHNKVKDEEKAFILHFNIDKSKLSDIERSKKNSNTEIKHKIKLKSSHKNEDSEKDNVDIESSEGMFKNDIPNDLVCNKCPKYEKTISQLKAKLGKYENKETLDKSCKIYNNQIKFISFSGKKISIKKTDVKCWWDCNNFKNLPCFLPEIYHKGVYHVIGCFCSFNCMLAYNLYYLKDSKMYQRKSLIFKLYREMYGLSNEDIIEIKEAPPRELLEDFGGSLRIDEYRRKFVSLNKDYIIYIPPVKPINIIVEEKNIDNQDTTDKKYVLKRSKPLSGMNSVIRGISKSKK